MVDETDLEYFIGKVAISTKVVGRKGIMKDMAHSIGVMEIHILVIGKMISILVMVYSNGLTATDMKGIGSRVGNTKEHTKRRVLDGHVQEN